MPGAGTARQRLPDSDDARRSTDVPLLRRRKSVRVVGRYFVVFPGDEVTVAASLSQAPSAK
jgi:hypothetical protein